MQIKYLRLKRFRRLMRSNIQEFEWTPTKQLMIMIGSNGSGKSSIMEELSPLPTPSKAARGADNFSPGGQKEFHCYHNGSLYVLLSEYGHGTGKHSFIRDDEELNSGGTFKIQEDLCLQEFGLTREFHEICTGRMKFTQMTTAKRREILTKMSVVDLSHAFHVFNILKTESRSQKGTVDTITKRLVNENHDIPSDNELGIMKRENNQLSERLNGLFLARQANQQPGFRDEVEASSILAGLVERAKAVLHSYPTLPERLKARDEAGFMEEKRVVQEQCAAIQAVINRMAEELESLRGANVADMEVSPEQLTNLESEITETNALVDRLFKDLEANPIKFPLVNLDLSNNPDQRLSSMFQRWYEITNAFPDNSEGYFSNAKIESVRESLSVLLGRRRELDRAEQTAAQRLSRLKACDTVVCPKCEHDFKPGVDETEGEKLETYLAQVREAMGETDLLIRREEEYIEAAKEYRGHVHAFTQMTREYSDFTPIWDYVTEHQLMFRTPSAIKMDLTHWFAKMKQYVLLHQYQADAERLVKRLANLNEIDRDAVAYNRNRCSLLEHEVQAKYYEQTTMTEYLQQITRGEVDIRRQNNEINSIIQGYQSWRERAMKHTEWLLDKAYEAEINDIQVKLAQGTHSLAVLTQREMTLRVLEGEVENAREVQGDLNLLIKALSPNGGLLGKYLMGFMQGVTTLVNAYISEIWTYKMEVLPSKVEKDELDYNFPLSISDGAVVAPDISRGSDSQLEMVDFSFMQAMRKFLHLDHMPLFLDEFGRTFDEQHRDNLIPFIMRLIENGVHQQIFYISHYVSTHGAFNQAEFMVLDPTNVTVPEHFNKNVQIK
jgi:hypothetical protein